jgi:hypothetical protein
MEATTSAPELLPASPAQAQIWLAQVLDQSRGTLNDALAVRLRGRLDTDALHRAVIGLAQRHEPLRTVFALREETLVQEIRPVEGVDYAILDLTGQPTRSLVAELAWQPFDLTAHPPLRVRVLRLGPDEHVLLLVLHHIASDLESPLIAYIDLARLYAAFTTATTPDLPPLATRYADVTREELGRLDAGAHAKALGYWAERLRDVPPLPGLGANRAVSAARGSSLDIVLPAELARTVRALAKDHHLTLHMFTQAVFRLLLWRFTGQADLLVASPVTQRTRAKLDGLIGPFLNVVAQRNPIVPTSTFLEIANAERAAVLGGMAYSRLPYGAVAELLRDHHDLPAVPPLEILFSFEEDIAFPTEFADLAAEPVDLGEISLSYQLAAKIVGEADGTMRMRWTYASSLDRELVTTFASGFREILDAVVADPGNRVDDLPRPFAEPVARVVLDEPDAPPGRAPEGPTECYVADIWADLLELDSVRDAEATVFALGGHSMTVARLAARLTQEFGLPVTTVDLFQHPTIAGQSRLLDDRLLADLAEHDLGDVFAALATLEP